jgi:benzoyl-CoA reductase subunit B
MAYETRPLENWKYYKEVIQQYYLDYVTGRENGRILATGSVGAPFELLEGIGDYAFLGGEPYGATCAAIPGYPISVFPYVEERGIARDVCAYCRVFLGSMFADRSPWGHFPKPDFCFTEHNCETHGLWFCNVAHYYGIPLLAFDVALPLGDWPVDERKRNRQIGYLASQLHDAIEWLEKFTGREYDDEKLIKGFMNAKRSLALWSQITELNNNIPAPLSLNMMHTLMAPAITMKTKNKAVEFFTSLKDEVQYRVDNQIAAIPEEKARLFHNIPANWHSLESITHVKQYGALFVGARYVEQWGCKYFPRDDGTIGWPENLEFQPKNREEAVWDMAMWYWKFEHVLHIDFLIDCTCKMLQDFKVDAAIFHLSRGCEGLTQGQLLIKKAVQDKLGIPTLSYEGNNADPREYDEAKVYEKLDSFMESLGLRKLTT